MPPTTTAVAPLAVTGQAGFRTGEAYHDWGKNPWVDAAKDHLSTFAADVDTASYTIARRKLQRGHAAAGRDACASRSSSTTSTTLPGAARRTRRSRS